MPGETTTVTVTETRRILKFAEGANPDVDAPFEIVTQEIVHTGQEAIDILQSYQQLSEEVKADATN
jgi:hypothetical protein